MKIDWQKFKTWFKAVNEGTYFVPKQASSFPQPEPTTVEGWFELADNFETDHHLYLAIDCYMRVLELDPQNPKANRFIGLQLIRNEYIRDYVKGIEHLQLYMQAKPGNETAMTGIADAYMGLGRADEALELYRRVVKQIPNWPVALAALGSALAKAAHYEEALEAYQKAVSIKPASDDQIELGHILIKLGRNDEALHAWNDVVTGNYASSENRKIAAKLMKKYQ